MILLSCIYGKVIIFKSSIFNKLDIPIWVLLSNYNYLFDERVNECELLLMTAD
jgi:hypothetical protein